MQEFKGHVGQLIFTREASVANERSEFVVSYESILGMPANDVRPFGMKELLYMKSDTAKHFLSPIIYIWNKKKSSKCVKRPSAHRDNSS